MNLHVENAEPAESAASLVERDLRRAIIELELKPGARLSEHEIADRLGVSRQPVREAMIKLQRSGFIDIRPQRGTTIVKISAAAMQEALFVRSAVETAVAERAATYFDAWQRKRIDTILARQEEAASKLDQTLFREQDELFHIALARGAGCGIAWTSIVELKAHMDRVCNLTMQTRDDLERRVREHKAIVAAIDAHDGAAAREAMAHHLGSILDQMPELESQHAGLFE